MPRGIGGAHAVVVWIDEAAEFFRSACHRPLPWDEVTALALSGEVDTRQLMWYDGYSGEAHRSRQAVEHEVQSMSRPMGVTRHQVPGTGTPPQRYKITRWHCMLGWTERSGNQWRAVEAGTYNYGTGLTASTPEGLRRLAGTQYRSWPQPSHADAERILARLYDAKAVNWDRHTTLRATYFPPDPARVRTGRLHTGEPPVAEVSRHPVDRRPRPIDMRDVDHRTPVTRDSTSSALSERATPKDIQCASCGEHPLYGFAGCGLIADQLTLSEVCSSQRCPYCDGMLMRPLAGSYVTPRREPLPYGTPFIRDEERKVPRSRWKTAAETDMWAPFTAARAASW